MKQFRFSKDKGKKVSHFDSNFILTKILQSNRPVQLSCMHLEKNGIIGFHKAAVSQLLLVVEGEGWVRSDKDGKAAVSAGDAVLWEKGEGHETATENGLTAIVIEGESLNLFSLY